MGLIKKVVKKPIEVEAMQLTKDREVIATAVEWVNDLDMSTSILGRNATIDIVLADGGVFIYTLEGKMLASFGDWIVKGVAGEFYPVKPDIFEQTYE